MGSAQLGCGMVLALAMKNCTAVVFGDADHTVCGEPSPLSNGLCTDCMRREVDRLLDRARVLEAELIRIKDRLKELSR